MSAITFTVAIFFPSLVSLTSKLFKQKFITLDSRWESLVWNWRLLKLNLAFPEKLEDWYYKDWDRMEESMIYVQSVWVFILPFFASRGYTTYQRHPTNFTELVAPPFPPVARNAAYPYARQVPTNVQESKMIWSLRVWAARDALGRDVVIKLSFLFHILGYSDVFYVRIISEVDNPSQELKVMQRLNSEKLRSDPANHTIYALDFLTFDKFVFVVMPRWDSSWAPEFENVSELMHFAYICFQTFDFLHRNRIVHLDFLVQNIGMNVVIQHTEMFRRTGLRKRDEVRYALFDFGASVAFPEDTVIEDTFTTDYLWFGVHNIQEDSVKYPYNPFKADIAFLGTALQTYVTHIENLVPELGPFFESLIDMNDPKQLSASQALAKFTDICDRISPDVAQASFDTRAWKNGQCKSAFDGIKNKTEAVIPGTVKKKDGEVITIL
ncbi:hypothetical protein JR316_0003099 [Psilocybe cubensis]|uniref:Uncharacterized protein n=2 Tax=Psilocybe cubensis TaxID=181762 RepID=A0ACB8H7F2_PSICU|nr:hypothetical protein JR316_0003099 [Psilocybe cubensis]KAH9483629.1 hypothetical protein JR316_0003099 [Psilocybe cubensis]